MTKDEIMKRNINAYLLALGISCLAAATHAETQPKFTMTPTTPTSISVPSTGSAVISYTVTNNTKITRTLTMQPLVGVIQETDAGKCSNPFTLSHGKSCSLSLLIDGSLIPSTGLYGGPVICKTRGPGDNNPDAYLCSQPSENNIIRATKSSTPPVVTGTVKCWGNNGAGQLGQGNTTDVGNGVGPNVADIDPVDLGTGRNAKQVALGDFFTCSLLDNNQVKCWGYNYYGQLGQGNTTDIGNGVGPNVADIDPVDLGTGRSAKAITAGEFHTCALLDNKQVKCWGYNEYGQLGQGNTTTVGNGVGPNVADISSVDLGTGNTPLALPIGGSDDPNHMCAILNIK